MYKAKHAKKKGPSLEYKGHSIKWGITIGLISALLASAVFSQMATGRNSVECVPTTTTTIPVTTTVPVTTTIPVTTTTIPEPTSIGIWVSETDIMQLPTSGSAWDAVRNAANKSWGTPTIANQDSTVDTDTLAGALVAVRLDDEAMREKVRKQLMTLAANHPYDRVLSLAREIPSYVIAADLVGLNDLERLTFSNFLTEAAIHKMDGHSGGNDLRSTARLSPNNWGTMARAALAAIDVYLGDKADLVGLAGVQRAWLGENVPNMLKYTSTNWHTATPKVGINPRGAVRNGNTLDGVLPEDQRRTGEYSWPAPKGSYPHEGLQGAVLASVILARAGVLDFSAGDNALIRAEQWLSGVNANPASGDDRNTPWMLNEYGGSFATSSTSPGKNIAWADWVYS